MNVRPLALRRLLDRVGPVRDPASDAELLRRFAGERDEAAFAALVSRHGPMVLGVCRRVLGDHHGAEDAFQATFLVLARRAGDASRAGLGPWLYGIAHRTARKARIAAARRRFHEEAAAALRPVTSGPAEPTPDLGPLLDEEIRKLPVGLRAAVLLCDVGGCSRRQAAVHLGWPEGTLSGRLTAARRRLAARLRRRGITPALAGLAAPLPPLLVCHTVRAAAQAAGTKGRVSAAAVLSDEVLHAMSRTPHRIAAGLTLAVALAGSTVVAVVAGTAPPGGEARRTDEAPAKPRSLDRFRFLAFDGFDGQLGLNWRPVRHDPSHVSLSKNPGRLTVTTQRGSIHGPTPAGVKDSAADPRTKNLFLIDNLLARDSDFVATTCVVGFRPARQYQQAGLVLYDDDDHYLKWTYEFNDGFLRQAALPDRKRLAEITYERVKLAPGTAPDPRVETKPKKEYDRIAWVNVALANSREESGLPYFIAVGKTDGIPEHFIAAEAAPNLPRVWLRVTKRGNLYDCATSTDGDRFVKRGTVDWGKGGPKRIGLIAQNGGEPGVPETDAAFEFFELRAP